MGRFKTNKQCPRCSGKDVILQDSDEVENVLYVCSDCDYEFNAGLPKNKKADDKHKPDHRAARKENSRESREH